MEDVNIKKTKMGRLRKRVGSKCLIFKVYSDTYAGWNALREQLTMSHDNFTHFSLIMFMYDGYVNIYLCTCYK